MSWTYRPALDGLRSVAVYLVVLFHCGLAVAAGGFIGVDLFFVLSGFLITNVLFSDIDDCGRIRFGRFYARRVRRLLPPAVVAITAICFIFLLIASVVQRLPLVREAQSALLYVANWRFLNESNDYFATGMDKSPFLHFWSLGIEEQFYVVFPLLLLLLTRVGRRRAWVPMTGLAALFALSLAAQVYWSHFDPNHAYYGTDSRAYQLLAGGLLACALRRRRKRLAAHTAEAAAAAGLAGVLLLGSGLLDLSISSRGIAATAASALLIGGLAVAGGGRLGALLSHRAPVYLGRVSYATYLWHWPVILVVKNLVTLAPLALAGVAGTIATALAALSYAVLETPVRRSPVLDRFRWPTVAAGVSLCGVVAIALVPPVLESPRRPIVTAAASQPSHNVGPMPVVPPRHGTTQRERVPRQLNWPALASDNGPARTCDATAPQQCIVVSGGAPHILIVGDSHARMLAPVLIQLAREHGLTLSMNVMSSCPWQALLTHLAQSPADQASCTASRDVWYRDVLPKLHPDVVILASYARDDASIYGHSLVRTGGSNESLHQLLKNTTNETLARITKTGARALILDSIIASSFDPLDCLARSKYLDQCVVGAPRKPPVSDRFYATAAARFDSVFTLNINPIVCPSAPTCWPMIDGISVWRNFNHYSTQILIRFRAKIWHATVKTGAL